jgi:hypothetical protein
MPLRVLSVLLIIGVVAIPERVQAGELPSSTGKVVSPAPPDTSAIDRKLDAIQLTEIEFRQVPFREAVGKVHQAAAKADRGEKPGVNMVIKLETDDTQDRSVTVTLPKGSLRQALTALAAAAKTKIVVQPHAVSFVAENEFTDHLVTKEYSAPGRSLFATFRGSVLPGGGRIAPIYGVREWFEMAGVPFPPGAFAQLTTDGKLVVRNSEANLRLVERVLDDAESETTR